MQKTSFNCTWLLLCNLLGYCNTNTEEDQRVILSAINSNTSIRETYLCMLGKDEIGGYNEELVEECLTRKVKRYGP